MLNAKAIQSQDKPQHNIIHVNKLENANTN